MCEWQTCSSPVGLQATVSAEGGILSWIVRLIHTLEPECPPPTHTHTDSHTHRNTHTYKEHETIDSLVSVRSH